RVLYSLHSGPVIDDRSAVRLAGRLGSQWVGSGTGLATGEGAMWLLAFMILIMPYEANPYLYIAPNLLGVFPDFTVIKLLGLVGFAWASMRLAGGHPHSALLTSRPATLFL